MSQTWDQLFARIESWTEARVDAATRALDELGDQIMADSKELCPVSPTNPTIEGVRKKRIKNPLYTGTSGALRDSGVSEPAVRAGDVVRKRLKYTDTKAAAVHERTAPRHGAALQAAFPQANVPNLKGQAKFLAVPMLKRRRSGPAYVAQAIAGVR